MKIQDRDFIEIDFTGKIKNGEIFDSTFKEELEKLHLGHNHEITAKPFVFCIGQGMFLDSLDKFLIGKNFGEEYSIELSPEQAFGNRQSNFVQKIPLKIFREQNINPIQGATLNFDGRIGKILAISGGRVIVDFNNPLAGKFVQYHIKILRKIENLNEKIKSLNEFYFRRNFDFEINEKDKKIILSVEKQIAKFIELFKDKFKDALGFDLEVREIEKEKEDKKTQ